MREFRDFDIEQLRIVAAGGERGVHTDFTTANVFTLLFISLRCPGLLEGLSVEEDPEGKRVRLTQEGRDLLENAEFERALKAIAAGHNDARGLAEAVLAKKGKPR